MQPTKEKDGKGGYTTSFEAVGPPVRACVEPLDGRETMVEHVLEGVSTYRIWIRWRGDVAAKWQIRLGSLELNVSAPPTNPDGRREWLVITATSSATLKAG